MDRGLLAVGITIGYYALGFLLTGGVSCLLVTVIYEIVSHRYRRGDPEWENKSPEERRKKSQLAALVGITERLMYTASILVGRPELIGVWILLKAVGEWGEKDKETGEGRGATKEYNIALIGTALSVLAGAASGYVMLTLLPPFPSLAHLRIPAQV